MTNIQSAPNNLGSTLLIATGLITAPVGIGFALMILGVALLRDRDGKRSFPHLHHELKRRVHAIQFWRMIKE